MPAALRMVSPCRTRMSCSIIARHPPLAARRKPLAWFASRRDRDGIGYEERLGRHFLRLFEAENVENRRRDVLQCPAAAQSAVALFRVDEDERHRVGGVCGVRLSGGGIEHQLAV